jgi:hypothetical protein
LEVIVMAGFGRFKLTDALPEQPERAQEAQSGGPGQGSAPVRKGKGKGKGKSKSATAGLDAEQVREARESSQAKNAEGSTRDRMVDIGRGNQQAGRQRAK